MSAQDVMLTWCIRNGKEPPVWWDDLMLSYDDNGIQYYNPTLSADEVKNRLLQSDDVIKSKSVRNYLENVRFGVVKRRKAA